MLRWLAADSGHQLGSGTHGATLEAGSEMRDNGKLRECRVWHHIADPCDESQFIFIHFRGPSKTINWLLLTPHVCSIHSMEIGAKTRLQDERLLFGLR